MGIYFEKNDYSLFAALTSWISCVHISFDSTVYFCTFIFKTVQPVTAGLLCLNSCRFILKSSHLNHFQPIRILLGLSVLFEEKEAGATTRV